jgi:hypothetical protein
MWARLTVSQPASNVSVNKHRQCNGNAYESVPLRGAGGAVGMPPNTISRPSLPALHVHAPRLFPKLPMWWAAKNGLKRKAILPLTNEKTRGRAFQLGSLVRLPVLVLRTADQVDTAAPQAALPLPASEGHTRGFLCAINGRCHAVMARL